MLLFILLLQILTNLSELLLPTLSVMFLGHVGPEEMEAVALANCVRPNTSESLLTVAFTLTFPASCQLEYGN